MTTNKSATLNLRIKQELKDAIERVAAEDHRSLTSWVEKKFYDDPKVKAYLSDKPKRQAK